MCNFKFLVGDPVVFTRFPALVHCPGKGELDTKEALLRFFGWSAAERSNGCEVTRRVKARLCFGRHETQETIAWNKTKSA